LILAYGAASPALAAPLQPHSKVVLALITAAQKEFDAANFERAGELFRDIWKQDKSARAALYNAARAYHLAAKLDRAEELYNEFLALPDVDPATQQKIATQQADIRDKRAERKGDEAANAEKDGDFQLAAGLWSEALALQAKPAWLLRHARALHRAGKKDAALIGYDRYLKEAPADAPGRNMAEGWRAEVAPPAAAMAAPAPVIAKQDQQGPSLLAWTALGAGVLVLAGGGTVLGLAASDDSTLNTKLQTLDSTGQINGISHANAIKESQRIESQYTLGWLLTGVGAAATGVGAWLALQTPSKVAVSPLPSGLLVAVRF